LGKQRSGHTADSYRLILLQGATYGSFGAACHDADGSFLPSSPEAACAKTHPQTGGAFAFWHPPLVTFHVWLWYPNPRGVFGEYNPLLTPFNED
jgi:hypothetical protein